MHTSVKLDTPCEFISLDPVNPFISKCQIKVCYVGDEPNRNHTVITKDVATELANSLPGSPIVGYYNAIAEDFEEHNVTIELSQGKFKVKDTTQPYGFVDLNAQCWFQWFKDDDEVEREYLCTEGYLWTGQYPEAQRILESGNNQSMELDEETMSGTWTKDVKGKPQFFIINEAIISKLCILGEDYEPCFEGASITKFSFDDNFNHKIYSMMSEIKDLLEGGPAQVFTTYAVEIGNSLWDALYRYVTANFPNPQDCWSSKYCIEGIYEEGEQKFAILKEWDVQKYYRLNFEFSESGLTVEGEIEEVTKTFVPSATPQFALADIQAYMAEYKKAEEEKKAEEDKKKEDEKGEKEPEEDKKKSEEGDGKTEDPKSEDDEKNSKSEDKDDEEKKKKNQYSLEEIPEYTELSSKFSELESKYNAIVAEKETLENQIKELTEFKLNTERAQKEKMIKEEFYMLSDEDKADVVANIDTYSLDDIESKLSVICVRNKVNFAALEGNDNEPESKPVTYNLGATIPTGDESIPAWVKAVMETEKSLN